MTCRHLGGREIRLDERRELGRYDHVLRRRGRILGSRRGCNRQRAEHQETRSEDLHVDSNRNGSTTVPTIGFPHRDAGSNTEAFAAASADSSRPYPRPLTTRAEMTRPVSSTVTSTRTTPSISAWRACMRVLRRHGDLALRPHRRVVADVGRRGSELLHHLARGRCASGPRGRRRARPLRPLRPPARRWRFRRRLRRCRARCCRSPRTRRPPSPSAAGPRPWAHREPPLPEPAARGGGGEGFGLSCGGGGGGGGGFGGSFFGFLRSASSMAAASARSSGFGINDRGRRRTQRARATLPPKIHARSERLRSLFTRPGR